MNESMVTLGRGQAANIRLADISISRKHTGFRLSKDGDVYITDENSKFGTLILQQTPIYLDHKKYDAHDELHLTISLETGLIEFRTAEP